MSAAEGKGLYGPCGPCVHDSVDVHAEKVLLVTIDFPADELHRSLLRLTHTNDVIRQCQVAEVRVEARDFPSQ